MLPCCPPDPGKSKFKERITTVIAELKISEARRFTLLHRYVAVVELYERLARREDRVYACLRAVVTMGSLVVLALLTLSDTRVYRGTVSFMLTFMLSVVVTGSNAFIELFAIQKRSRVYWLTFKKLESEGWEYAHSAGKYAGQDPADTFPAFLHTVVTTCAAALVENSALTRLQRGPAPPPLDLEPGTSSVAGTGVSTLPRVGSLF